MDDGVSTALTAAMGMGGGQAPIFTEKGGDSMEEGEIIYEENISEVLRILRKENGEEAFFKWAIRGLWCILAEKVLQQNLYAQVILKKWSDTTGIFQCTYDSETYKCTDITEKCVRDMWEEWQTGCSSQGRKLPEQQSEQFNGFVQKLPHETAQKQKYVYCLRKTSEGIGLLQQALSEVQKIWESDDGREVLWNNYRIRKLTERECWRLMGFSDKDFEKAAAVNSKTQLYKQAGNSIVENVLVAIFGQMLPGKETVYKDLGNKNYNEEKE